MVSINLDPSIWSSALNWFTVGYQVRGSAVVPGIQGRRSSMNHELTSELARQVIDELDAQEAAAGWSGDDRRGAQRHRYRYRLKARLVVHAGGTTGTVPVMGRNISRGGFGFVYEGRLYPNTECTVMLRTTDGGLVPVAGRLIHCREVRDGVFEGGVEFLESVEVERFTQGA